MWIYTIRKFIGGTSHCQHPQLLSDDKSKVDCEINVKIFKLYFQGFLPDLHYDLDVSIFYQALLHSQEVFPRQLSEFRLVAENFSKETSFESGF
jgi:hypothetical protein